MGKVFFYDHSNIDQFVWPNSEDGRKAKNYLLPLIKGDVTTYIGNVQTKVHLIASQDFLLPITVNEAEYQNSYIASNYYGLRFYEEIIGKKHPILAKLQKPLIVLGQWFLKKIEINKCIFFNNWLMTNNIHPNLQESELDQIVSFLKTLYPDHVFIYRNIDSLLRKNLLSSLEKNQFYLLKIRDVFMYEPAKKDSLSAKALSHHRKDKKIQEKYGFTIERELHEKDIDRMIELYEKVYLQNYTSFSPHYKNQYLQNILQNQIFQFIGVKKGETIEGIIGYFIRDKTMIAPFFGFNTDAPYSGELYRLLSVLILEEAERENVILNDSSGGEKTKKYRGLVPYPEFMAIYPHHLKLTKRAFWNLVSFICKLFKI